MVQRLDPPRYNVATVLFSVQFKRPQHLKEVRKWNSGAVEPTKFVAKTWAVLFNYPGVIADLARH